MESVYQSFKKAREAKLAGIRRTRNGCRRVYSLPIEITQTISRTVRMVSIHLPSYTALLAYRNSGIKSSSPLLVVWRTIHSGYSRASIALSWRVSKDAPLSVDGTGSSGEMHTDHFFGMISSVSRWGSVRVHMYKIPPSFREVLESPDFTPGILQLQASRSHDQDDINLIRLHGDIHLQRLSLTNITLGWNSPRLFQLLSLHLCELSRGTCPLFLLNWPRSFPRHHVCNTYP